MRPPTTNNSTHYACRSSGPYASSAATSPGRRVFPPDRLATCLRHALAEILQRPNPARRHRTYPRVTKRAARTTFPRKMLSHTTIRHRGPPEIQLTRWFASDFAAEIGVRNYPRLAVFSGDLRGAVHARSQWPSPSVEAVRGDQV